MIINSSEEFYDRVKYGGVIELAQGIYTLNQTIYISSNTEILGNNSLIIGNFIVLADLILKNINIQCMDFNVSLIHLKENSIITAVSSSFYGHENCCIFDGANSEIYLLDCFLSNFSTAIHCHEESKLQSLNCSYNFCKMCIHIILTSNIFEYENIESKIHIINSKNKNSDKFLIIDLYSGVNSLTNIYNFLRAVYLDNKGYIALNFINSDDYVIKSLILKSYEIFNHKDMYEALNIVEEGNILIIKKSIDGANFTLNTNGISIIGDENFHTFYSSESSIYNSAFIINSSYNFISNINIHGNKQHNFRDGIKFESLGGRNTIIKNVNFLYILRRGISLWGEETNYTTIANCTFSNILNQCGVHCWKKAIINSCHFLNIPSAIRADLNSNITLSNNSVECCDNFIEINSKFKLFNILIKDNTTKNIKKYINTI